jgi:fatty acid desaturase
MALDELQKPNIGTPEFAHRRPASERKLWAIVTTVAFAVFWFAGLFTAAGLYGEGGLHWSMPVLTVLGLGVGLFARRRVDAD